VHIDVREKAGKTSISVTNSSRYLDESTIQKIEKGGYSTKPDGNGFGYRISKMLIETLGGQVSMRHSMKEDTVTVEIILD